MTRDDRLRMLALMSRHGGGFTRLLAEAWMHADEANAQRLAAAFPDLVQRYGPGSGAWLAEFGQPNTLSQQMARAAMSVLLQEQVRACERLVDPADDFSDDPRVHARYRQAKAALDDARRRLSDFVREVA